MGYNWLRQLGFFGVLHMPFYYQNHFFRMKAYEIYLPRLPPPLRGGKRGFQPRRVLPQPRPALGHTGRAPFWRRALHQRRKRLRGHFFYRLQPPLRVLPEPGDKPGRRREDSLRGRSPGSYAPSAGPGCAQYKPGHPQPLSARRGPGPHGAGTGHPRCVEQLRL